MPQIRLSKMKLAILRALAPLVVLVLGALAVRAIVRQKPQAERRAAETAAPLVELLELQPLAAESRVRGMGVVAPEQEIVVQPQVSGQVVYVSPSLVPGGRVKKGAVLARIDDRDYQLALEQQRGAVREAALDVEREQAQQELARHEWEAMGEAGPASPLFSRESQRAAAEARLASGQSGVARAQLNLERTVLRAPFAASVISESVDVGQVIGPQSTVARLVGTGEMRVLVSLPLSDLALIDLTALQPKGAKEPIRATVMQRVPRADPIVREGRVTRLVTQLDEQTRRAQLVVSIPDALSTEHGLPLLPGAHVTVEIVGRAFESVFRLPRIALYEGDVVWVENQGRLEQRSPKIAWGSDEVVYASSGLAAGERLVVTRLASPIQGMAIEPLHGSEPVGSH